MLKDNVTFAFARPWGKHKGGLRILIVTPEQVIERKIVGSEIKSEKVVDLHGQDIKSYTSEHNFVEVTQVVKEKIDNGNSKENSKNP